MSRLLAVVFVLLVPAAVRADVGSPTDPVHRLLPVDVTFVVEDDYPDYAFFLWSHAQYVPSALRLPVSRSNPARVVKETNSNDYRLVSVYAVRKELLIPFGDSPPPRDWFLEKRGQGVWELENPERGPFLDLLRSAWFSDNRERAEITYRIEVGPNGGRLVKVSENVGHPWYRRGWIAAGVLIPIGLFGLVVWRVRRSCRSA